METAQIKIEGMTCQGCVAAVTRALGAVPGVQKVDVSLAEGKADVSYDAAKSGVDALKRAVENAGYDVK